MLRTNRLGLMVFFAIVLIAANASAPSSAARDAKSGLAEMQKVMECPRTPIQARERAKSDVILFRKELPSGVWPLFVHRFREKYRDCSPFIKATYLGAAKRFFDPVAPPRIGKKP